MRQKLIWQGMQVIEKMERETGLEPATSSLGSWHSTTELLPHSGIQPHYSTSICTCVLRLDHFQQGPAGQCLTNSTIVKQISLSLAITQKLDRRVPCSSVQLGLCRRAFLIGYAAIQQVMDVQGFRVRFISEAFCAYCMTGAAKTEQFD